MQRPRNARDLDLLRARLGQLHLRVAEQARLAGEPLARALLRGIGRGHRAGEAHRALSAGAPPAAGLRGREVRALQHLGDERGPGELQRAHLRAPPHEEPAHASSL